MPNIKDLTYLTAREKASRELATESTDISVRTAHIAMAAGYAAQIRALRVAEAT